MYYSFRRKFILIFSIILLFSLLYTPVDAQSVTIETRSGELRHGKMIEISGNSLSLQVRSFQVDVGFDAIKTIWFTEPDSSELSAEKSQLHLKNGNQIPFSSLIKVDGNLLYFINSNNKSESIDVSRIRAVSLRKENKPSKWIYGESSGDTLQVMFDPNSENPFKFNGMKWQTNRSGNKIIARVEKNGDTTILMQLWNFPYTANKKWNVFGDTNVQITWNQYYETKWKGQTINTWSFKVLFDSKTLIEGIFAEALGGPIDLSLSSNQEPESWSLKQTPDRYPQNAGVLVGILLKHLRTANKKTKAYYQSLPK